jgi:hypothetical protein
LKGDKGDTETHRQDEDCVSLISFFKIRKGHQKYMKEVSTPLKSKYEEEEQPKNGEINRNIQQ